MIAPATSALGSTLSAQQRSRITEAAQKFEAMAIGQLLAPMLDTVDTSKGPFGGGQAEAAWKPMLTEALGKQMAKHGGLGLAKPIMDQLLRAQEARSFPPPLAGGAGGGVATSADREGRAQ